MFMNQLNEILYKVKQSKRDGLILNLIYGGLKKKKFEFSLFYLFKEGLFGDVDVDIQPKIEPIEVEHLTSTDMAYLAVKAERDYSEEKMLQVLSEGCKCMGIKYKDKFVAWAWYNLRKCDNSAYSFSFELKENEAYLFGQRTLSAYQGRSLAPYLKYQLYKHLADMGRTNLFAIAHFSNLPSIKFRRKLNARPLKLFMNVKIFNIYHRNFLLKNYRN
jgi:ribosomal protein S18 acetylase RimI-like enzyme